MTRLVYAYFKPKEPKSDFSLWLFGSRETEEDDKVEGWYLVARIGVKDKLALEELQKKFKSIKVKDISAELPVTLVGKNPEHLHFHWTEFSKSYYLPPLGGTGV